MKTTNGISIFPSYVQIPGSERLGTKNITLHELSLDRYCEFLKYWEVGVQQALADPGASFSYLWLHSPTFRDSMVQALQVVGIEQPGNLKPAHLEELLLLAQTEDDPSDCRGVIFRLHQDIPKFPAPTGIAQTEQPTQIQSATWLSKYFPTLAYVLQLAPRQS